MEYKSNINKEFIWACAITIGLSISILIIYCIKFNGGLSNDTAVWGQFGDFFGGICSLFLSAMNIWIFYKLTKTISEQEEKRANAQLYLEKQKIKLQKQEELIESFCKAIDKTFSVVDIDNGIAKLNTKDFDDTMQIYNGLKKYGCLLHTLERDEFNKAYELLFRIYRLIHDSGVDDDDKSDWDERMFGLYMKLCKIEKLLKNEYVESFNKLIK